MKREIERNERRQRVGAERKKKNKKRKKERERCNEIVKID